jgi:predicted ATP-grasp superfamily ATP-dependent carboligase
VTVLSGHSHGSLGVIRTLGRLRVPVYVIRYSRRPSPPVLSRYCRDDFFVDFHFGSSARSVDQLLEVGRKIGRRSVLIPYSDDGAALLARNFDRLSEWFIYPKQDPELVDSLIDKARMAALATACGVPTPEIFVPRSRAEVRAYARHGRFPLMLKGIDGRRLAQRTGHKMMMVLNADELLQQYDALEDPAAPNLMIQEYIPGADGTVWMFNGYFNEHSQVLAAFTGKKIRQIPIHNGVTSLGICAANPTLLETTTRFMTQLGYKGMVDIDFCFDGRDGTYKVLDVNPRIGGTFRLFVDQSGWDVARIMYLDITRQPVPTLQPREGRKWFVEFADLRSFYNHKREGSLTLSKWLRSFRGAEEAAYFAADDLLPFAAMLANAGRSVLQWAFKKTVKTPRMAAIAPSPDVHRLTVVSRQNSNAREDVRLAD